MEGELWFYHYRLYGCVRVFVLELGGGVGGHP